MSDNWSFPSPSHSLADVIATLDELANAFVAVKVKGLGSAV
jgi:hypothetical protein